MTLLIVEPDRAMRELLDEAFARSGFAVRQANDGATALQLMRAGSIELVVLGWGGAEAPGAELPARLRNLADAPPVIVLSADSGIKTRLSALSLGADDFIERPFSFEEVLARVRAVLRRSRPSGEAVLRCADLVLHRAERRVSRGGLKLTLTGREFALLEYLLLHPGEPVSRSRISAGAWKGEDERSSNTIDVCVYNLRLKVDAPFKRPLIHTVRGVGYLLSERT